MRISMADQGTGLITVSQGADNSPFSIGLSSTKAIRFRKVAWRATRRRRAGGSQMGSGERGQPLRGRDGRACALGTSAGICFRTSLVTARRWRTLQVMRTSIGGLRTSIRTAGSTTRGTRGATTPPSAVSYLVYGHLAPRWWIARGQARSYERRRNARLILRHSLHGLPSSQVAKVERESTDAALAARGRRRKQSVCGCRRSRRVQVAAVDECLRQGVCFAVEGARACCSGRARRDSCWHARIQR